MYVAFYDDTNNNVFSGKGDYPVVEHIPDTYPYIEITQALFETKYPLEIYDDGGELKARIDPVKKAEIDADRNTRQTRRQEVRQIISNIRDTGSVTTLQIAKMLMIIYEIVEGLDLND